jgi:hypothetical protein
MSALDNARHESFAQGVALGKSATEAYKEAGYSVNNAEANAYRLMENDGVKARIQELQSKLAIKSGITRAEYLSELVDGLRNLPKDHGNWPRIADLTAKACGFNEPDKVEINGGMDIIVRIGGKTQNHH